MTTSLALPWFYGSSDGDELTISGLIAEPGFVAGMLASAAGIACSRGRPCLAALSASALLGLTIWMLPRGERYSGYDLGPGPYLAVALGAGILLATLWSLTARRRRGPQKPNASKAASQRSPSS